MRETGTKRVSLAFELADIEAALRAVREIALALGTHGFTNLRSEKAAPRSIEASLVLIGDRLRLLRRAISGSADPALLHNTSNTAPPGSSPEPDIVLTAWKNAATPSASGQRARRAGGKNSPTTNRGSR